MDFNTSISTTIYTDWAIRLGGSKRYLQILRRMLQALRQMPAAPLKNFSPTAREYDVSLPPSLMKKLDAYVEARGMSRTSVLGQAVNAGLYKYPEAPSFIRTSGVCNPSVSVTLSPREEFILSQEARRPSNFGLSIHDLIRRAVANLPEIASPKSLDLKKARFRHMPQDQIENASRIAQAMDLTVRDMLRSFAWLAVTSCEGMDPVKRYLSGWLVKPVRELVPQPLSEEEAEEWRLK